MIALGFAYRMFTILTFPLYLMFQKALKKTFEASKLDANHLNLIDRVITLSGQRIAMSVKVPRDLEQDFLNYRSETYFKPMTDGVSVELARLLLGRNKPKVPSLETLAKMFLETAGALMTRWDDAEQCFSADLKVLKVPLWPGYYQELDTFKFEPQRNFYCITDRKGNAYTPEHPHWETAVIHLVGTYSLSIPAASHNWVHFAYPDSMAAAVFTSLRRDTNLYRLLFPHTRFTNRINYQAVWVQKSTDNRQKSLACKITPWKSFPMTAEDFRNGVLDNTSRHYQNLAQHFMYPRDMDERIPYFKFLKGYYLIIERFVKALAPYLEDAEFELLSQTVERNMPGFKGTDKVSALATLIWQVSVLHTTEHRSYYDLIMPYGFTELKKPISEPMSWSEVSAYNRYKFRCFLRVFVNFNPNPKLDQSLCHYAAYQFEAGSELEKLAQTFVSELKAYDMRLRNEGKAIVNLDRIVQSVCF